MSEDDRVCVGAIAGAFGVRGDVRLKSFTGDPEAVATYGPVETEDRSRSFEIRITGAIKAGFSARLEGVSLERGGGCAERCTALCGTGSAAGSRG